MAKMGANNKITKERYNAAKKWLHTPADDEKVAKRFDFSVRTSRMIRNTKNYEEYLEQRFRYHGHPRKQAQSSSTKRHEGAVEAKGKTKNTVQITREDCDKARLMFLMIGTRIDLIYEWMEGIDRAIKCHRVTLCILAALAFIYTIMKLVTWILTGVWTW